MRKSLVAALVALTALTAPSAAIADVLLTPYAGLTFGSKTGSDEDGELELDNRWVLGGSLAIVGSRGLGFEVDLGFIPDFFEPKDLEVDILGTNNVTTFMGNVMFVRRRRRGPSLRHRRRRPDSQPARRLRRALRRHRIQPRGQRRRRPAARLGPGLAARRRPLFPQRLGVRRSADRGSAEGSALLARHGGRFFRILKGSGTGPWSLRLTRSSRASDTEGSSGAAISRLDGPRPGASASGELYLSRGTARDRWSAGFFLLERYERPIHLLVGVRRRRASGQSRRHDLRCRPGRLPGAGQVQPRRL